MSEDEKKEREKIKKKIKEKKKKRDDFKNKRKKLESDNEKLENIKKCANENIKNYEQKKKYEDLINAIKNAQKYIGDASKDINNSFNEYKMYFKGNAASKIIPNYSESISQIAREKSNLDHIFASASGGKRACEDMIKNLNGKMGKNTQNIADCKRIVRECDTKISDNKRIIGEYNNKINTLEKEISRLQRKL